MAIKDNTFRLIGKFGAGQLFETSVSTASEKLNGEKQDNAFRSVLDIINNIGTIAEILALYNEADRRDAEASIREPLRALKAAQKAAEQAEEAGDAGRLIPVAALRTPARALENGANVFLNAAAQPILILEKVNKALKESNAKFKKIDSYLDIIGNLGTAAFVVQTIDDFTCFVSERDAAQAQSIETGFVRDSGAAQIENSDNSDSQENELVLPEEIAARLEVVYQAFNARGSERAAQIEEARAVMESLGDKASALSAGDIDAFLDDLRGAVTAVKDSFDSLSFLGDIDALAAVSDALEAVAKVLNIALDAIQPVLDFFGPVVRLIEKVLDKIEKAIGLDKLEQIIKDAVQDQIDALLEPILEELQKVLDQLSVDFFSILDEFFAEFLDLRQKLEDLVLDPIAKIGEDGETTLTDEAIIVGQAVAEMIQLSLDPKAQDDNGGFAMAGAGNDTIIGTDKIDLIYGGEGDDTIVALAGDDLAFGGDGKDEILGGAGADDLMGDGGDDTIDGGTGNDFLVGGADNDTLIDGDGDDRLEGGSGMDLLIAGLGDDVLNGGDDADILRASSGSNTLDGEAGLDTIETYGSATAENLILDASAILRGGAGTDHVRVGASFAPGADLIAGASFDGGAGFDIFEVSGIDLLTAPDIDNFEVLQVSTVAGAVSEIVASVGDLRAFDRLLLTGDGAVDLAISGGAFDLNIVFDDASFVIDSSGLQPFANPLDGEDAGVEAVPFSQQLPLTIRLADDVGSFVGTRATSLGLTVFGSDAGEMIIDGGGSDIIRQGLGADTIVLSTGDLGNRFNLDGAVGDVVLGTAADFDGDTIVGLTNRTDRIRIEDASASEVTSVIVNGQTQIMVQGAVFFIDRPIEKLLVRDGDGYVEILENNIPPTAVPDDLIVDGAQVVFDPTDNDFDIDAAVDQEIVLGDAEFDLLTGTQGLAEGESITTELGATLTRVGNELRYAPRLEEINFRTFAPSDVDPAHFQYIFDELGFSTRDIFDVTEDLPFFGFDSINYIVRDAEGEASNTASIDFVVRPNADEEFSVIGLESNSRATQSAVVGFNYQSFDSSLTSSVLTSTDRIRFDFAANESIADATRGNDFWDINTGNGFDSFFRSGSGNDVLIAQGDGHVRFDGGTNADWVEGADGDDILSPGGLGDVIIDPSLRLGLPASAETLVALAPNIVLSGGGNNILGSSIESDLAALPVTATRSRDTIFHLDGERDIVTGPLSNDGGAGIKAASGLGLLATTALALQDDTLRGFDTDDMILMVFDKGTFGTGRTVTLDRPVISKTRETRDALLVTDRDMSANLGDSVFDVLGYLGNDSFNLFPEIDFQPSFSNSFFIGAPGSNGGTFYEFVDGYNGSPAILQQAIEASAFAPDGGTNPQTLVTISLKSFRMSDGGGDFPSHNSVLVEDPIFAADYEGLDDPLLPREDLIDGAHLTFSFLLDGFYQDRFDIDIVNPRGTGGAIGNVSDYEFVGSREGDYSYQYVGPESVSNNVVPGLAIRYKSAAPEVVSDTIQVARGETIVFDVRQNDTDADGDTLNIEGLAGLDPAFSDGDFSNGELVARLDPNTGRSSGVFAFTAPDEIGGRSFSYTATDGEFSSLNAAIVSIDITGLAPVAGDDLIILPWNAGPFIAGTALLSNDFDPDGDPLETFEASVFGDNVVRVADGVTLSAAALAALQADTVDIFGLGGSVESFDYALLDQPDVGNSAGLSELAKVQVSMASELTLSAPQDQTMLEDGSLTLDVLSGREGGFGAVRIVNAGVVDTLGTIVMPTGVDISFETGVIFVTPQADVSGLTIPLVVEIEDALGTRTRATFEVEITPVDDPVRLADGNGTTLGILEATEDEPLLGALQLIDIDSAVQPVPSELVDLKTSGGGTLNLIAGALPTVWNFVYTPAQNAFGSDSIEIDLTSGEMVLLQFNVLAVEDAPILTSPIEAQVIEVGGNVSVTIFDQFFDAEDNLSVEGIVVSTNDEAVRVEIDDEGNVALFGQEPGSGQISYSATDQTGRFSGLFQFDWRVNAGPDAQTDAVEVDAISAQISIDAIGNDTDLEGPVSYVTDADGTPIVIDPDSLVEGGDAGGTLGTVVWSESDGGFLYTAPDDLDLTGQRDVFFYQIEDEDGSKALGTVTVDLNFPQDDGEILRILDPANSDFVANALTEAILLTDEEDRVIGTADALDGDEIFGFDLGDEIVITDFDPTQITISVERLRSDLPAPATFDFENPNLTALFGGPSFDALTDAWIGDTLLTVSDGTQSTQLTLLGAFTGTWSANASDDGGTRLHYAPTAQGEGLLAGTPQDDDLRAQGEAEILAGAFDDILTGQGSAISMNGQAGQDALVAGTGVTSMTGGSGADLFVLTQTYSSDQAPILIEDFDPLSGDRIALRLADYLDPDSQTVRTDLLNLRPTDDGILLEARADPEDDTSAEMVALALLRPVQDGPGLISLTGTSSRDRLQGTEADELINGGTGSDTYFGGGGADTFVFDKNGVRERETIRDFETGADSILLDGAFSVRFTSRYAAITTEEDGDSILVYGDAQTVEDLAILTTEDQFVL